MKFLKYFLIGAVLFASCKKTLDINTNPNDPVTISVSRLLPTVERNLGDGLALGGATNGGLSQVLAVYTHQMSTREEPDQYGATGNEYYINLAWPKLYRSIIGNSDQIIADATTQGNFKYAGIAKIIKAYTFSVLVDVFGDVPFTEANKLKEGIRYAKFDDDATIYPALIALINEGIADLNNTASNPMSPAADDIIYQGNVDKWVRAANTIKLKLYNQTRKVADVKTQVAALITENKLISATDQSFLIPYGPNGSTDDRNPGYGDYFATQRSNHISPYFYEILKGYNTRINNGIVDPRIPYYFYNQLKANQAPREGNQTEYRDGAFVSIYFGSVGPDRDRTQQNSISLLGLYPVGGKYDDGSGAIATGTSGTGAAPYRLLTYADRLYIEAELIQAGVMAGDARAKVKSAIEESFKQVDYVVTRSASTAPVLSGTTAATNYVNSIMGLYDAGDANRKLEITMTQKWISSYGSAVDQYTDYRRTGFPVMFNPADPTMAPGGRVQPPIDGDPVNPGAQKSVPVQLTRNYPLSLPWAQNELETNPKAPQQKSPSTYKVFWMP